ncbi:MAG: S41 family peptidase [Pirellulaceae bacterium]|nr:S41 family peptidase [Pirellulaceae bacterium]
MKMHVLGRIVVCFCLAWGTVGLAWGQEPATGQPKQDGSQARPAGDEEDGSPTSPAGDEYFELLKVFVDALDQVDRNYVRQVDRRRLMEAALRGMLSELDPYSDYIPPAQIDRFRTGVESEFGGVGIQVRQQGENLEIISPIYGTPAYAAGLMAGDVITEIEGQSARGITIDDAVKLMKGKIGTEVSLKIQSPQDKQPRSVKLRRDVIRVQTVLGDHRRDDDTWQFMYDDEAKIGLIRILTFGRHTAEELKAALAELKQQGMRALVLDLRYNPGGLLTSAIEVCDLFIDSGRIVSTEGRSSPKRTWEAHEPGTEGDFPMAVLINHFSASASEIVSACLQDHQRAIVVGQRSWGKGSVQNVVELEDGRSALKLTTATYLRPNGANIHRHEGDDEQDEWGVRPNEGYEISLSDEEARAIEQARRERELIRRRPAAAEGEKPASEKPASEKPTSEKPTSEKPTGEAELPAAPETGRPVDRQLEKALEYLRQQLGEGPAPEAAAPEAGK